VSLPDFVKGFIQRNPFSPLHLRQAFFDCFHCLVPVTLKEPEACDHQLVRGVVPTTSQFVVHELLKVFRKYVWYESDPPGLIISCGPLGWQHLLRRIGAATRATSPECSESS